VGCRQFLWSSATFLLHGFDPHPRGLGLGLTLTWALSIADRFGNGGYPMSYNFLASKVDLRTVFTGATVPGNLIKSVIL
jgi:hypothetical protein